MTLPHLYDTSTLSDAAATQVGRKAFRLAQLVNQGWQVPSFYVISVAAFDSVLEGAIPSNHPSNFDQAAARIRSVIERASIPPDLERAIASAHNSCFSDETIFAVRSSAASEDGQNHSFAGLHETVLGVKGSAAIWQAVKRVWASSVSPQSLAYRKRHALVPIDLNMAVIVQQLVHATRSGVCFSCDPVTKRSDRIIVCSTYGLGERLVSGEFASDTYTVDRSTLQIESRLIDKPVQTAFSHASLSTEQIDVPVDKRGTSSLSEDEVRAVSTMAIQLERTFGTPQDVEFCFSQQGELILLQTRPVTASYQANSPVAGNPVGAKSVDRPSEPRAVSGNGESDSAAQPSDHLVWDNSNIIESYSGVTTPMTFSFIRRAYSIVYHCFSEVMGISPRVVERNRDAFDNMLGFFHGRVYYNLKNWYRLVRMFPGYHYNRHFMESMMGVKKSLVLEDDQGEVGALRRWLVEFPSLLKLIARSGWNFLRIRGIVSRFQQRFHDHYEPWSRIDFDSLSPQEIKRLYDMMEKEMLWNWKAPIINDFYVMVFYGVLRKLCVRWCDDETASLQNGLVCGEGGLLSDQPAKLLVQMTQVAQRDPLMRKKLLSEDVESLPEQIADDPRFAYFNTLMSQFLQDFGLRCANELKLESYSYADQPHRLYQIIRSYLVDSEPPRPDLSRIHQREQTVRQDAERRARERIGRYRFSLPRHILFRWVLRSARQGIRDRENMRFARTRIYGILRRMLRALGTKFQQQCVLNDREDIFFLTIDEVWDYLRGTAVTTDLASLAEFRKAEYARYRHDCAPPGDRFETFGLPYQSLGSHPAQPTADRHGAPKLAGTGCCPGVVTGRVQVIDDPSLATEFLGSILVAERTDPGWVLLYPAFSGILVERGSVLSHSAIVAREMGIPTIVGVPGLVQQVRSGQRVQMDGSSGEIQLLGDPYDTDPASIAAPTHSHESISQTNSSR